MPLITLPKEAVDFEEAIKLLEEYPDDKPAYIRLNVLIKDYLAPDCNETCIERGKREELQFCYIKPIGRSILQMMKPSISLFRKCRKCPHWK